MFVGLDGGECSDVFLEDGIFVGEDDCCCKYFLMSLFLRFRLCLLPVTVCTFLTAFVIQSSGMRDCFILQEMAPPRHLLQPLGGFFEVDGGQFKHPAIGKTLGILLPALILFLLSSFFAVASSRVSSGLEASGDSSG